MLNPTLARTRSQLGVATRLGDAEQVREAKRAHAEAKLEAYIRRTVESAPPLTAEQRDRLALLLQGGGSDAA